MIRQIKLWLQRSEKPDPGRGSALKALTGAPEKPRAKAYTSNSGHVYQYVYRGLREIDGAEEYVFSVTKNGASWFFLPVHLDQRLTGGLPSNFRYALAKMALFDGLEHNPETSVTPVRPEAFEIESFLKMLGIAPDDESMR
jgi:hypothetical protein